jgi:hypothetical protein
MKIDLTQELKDFDGKVIPSASGKSAKVKGVVIDALIATYQDEANLGGEEKLKRWELASKINKGDFDLTAEDIVLAKKLVGKAYGPLVVGQVWNILEVK